MALRLLALLPLAFVLAGRGAAPGGSDLAAAGWRAPHLGRAPDGAAAALETVRKNAYFVANGTAEAALARAGAHAAVRFAAAAELGPPATQEPPSGDTAGRGIAWDHTLEIARTLAGTLKATPTGDATVGIAGCTLGADFTLGATLGAARTLGAAETIGAAQTLGAVHTLGAAEATLGVARTLGPAHTLGADRTVGAAYTLGAAQTPGAVLTVGAARTLGADHTLGAAHTLGADRTLGTAHTLGVEHTLGAAYTLDAAQILGAAQTFGATEATLDVARTYLGAALTLGALETLGDAQTLGIARTLGAAPPLGAARTLAAVQTLGADYTLGAVRTLGAAHTLGAARTLAADHTLAASRTLGADHTLGAASMDPMGTLLGTALPTIGAFQTLAAAPTMGIVATMGTVDIRPVATPAPRLARSDLAAAFPPKTDELSGTSTVDCVDAADGKNPVCKIENLYYSKDAGFFLVSPKAAALPKQLYLTDAGSIAGHANFKFVVGVEETVPTGSVVSHDRRTHFFSRFLPSNVFHLLHDDVLPLLATVAEFSPDAFGDEEPGLHGVDFVAADHREDPSGRTALERYWLRKLPPASAGTDDLAVLASSFKARDFSLRAAAADGSVHVWKDAVVGLRRDTVWYDYGLYAPQRPVDDDSADLSRKAAAASRAAEFLARRVLADPGPAPPAKPRVLLFARRSDRLILNERVLAAGLADAFPDHAVEAVALETHGPRELVALLRSADLIVGMHGSMLGLAMLAERAAILEMFPYGVNSSEYRVYRRMAELRGFAYGTWENHDEKATVPPESAPPSKGGLTHLPEDDARRIQGLRWVAPHVCCYDPSWLYRIYSDTVVDVPAVVGLAKELVAKLKSA